MSVSVRLAAALAALALAAPALAQTAPILEIADVNGGMCRFDGKTASLGGRAKNISGGLLRGVRVTMAFSDGQKLVRRSAGLPLLLPGASTDYRVSVPFKKTAACLVTFSHGDSAARVQYAAQKTPNKP